MRTLRQVRPHLSMEVDLLDPKRSRRNGTGVHSLHGMRRWLSEKGREALNIERINRFRAAQASIEGCERRRFMAWNGIRSFWS